MSLVRRLLAWIPLLAYLLWEILVSGLRVAWEIVTPRPRSRPGIIRVPLDVDRPSQITLLAHLSTLTPGSIALEVSEDRKFLYVHEMFLDDIDAEVRRVKEGLEARVKKVIP